MTPAGIIVFSRVILALLGWCLFASPVAASMNWSCLPTPLAHARITSDGFFRLGIGVTVNNQGAVEFWIGVDGRWLATLSRPNGMTCVKGIGYGWQGEQPCFGGQT